MSISSSTNRSDYVGNGNVDTYNYTFRIFEETDLTVIVRDTDNIETTLTLTTDYTVTGVGSSSGGTIVLVNSGQAWLDAGGDLLSDYALTIRRVLPLVQETDIRNQGAFYPEIHEDQFDKLAMIAQQQGDDIARSIRMPQTVSSVDFNPELPASLLGSAGTTLKVNDTGDGFAAGPSSASIAAAEGFANDAEASSNHAANHNTTAQRWANYTSGTVVDADTLVNSGEYSAKYYANSAISYASDASDAADAALVSQNAAAASATTALGYKNDAATSASAASTSASNASTSASNASTSASNASTYATNASNSASAAATSATNASNSASAASTSATNASNSASSASTYATNASNSASAASTSATNASTSAAQAAAYMSASQWNDVVYKTYADSPITISTSDSGKIFSISCAGGNVTVNLPSIAALDLTGPWSIGIMKNESSTNSISILRDGTDTIEGSTSKSLVNYKQGFQLIPDTDQAPDQWTALEFGPTTTLYSPTIYTPSTDVITLDGQASTPTSPSSGYYKAYVKDSTGKLTILDSAGQEKSAGGVSGWAASTSYAVGDLALYGQFVYSCISAHTSSSTMETDLAGTSPKWKIVNTEPSQQNLMTYGFDFECGDVAGWTAVGCATVTNGLLVSAGSGGAAFSAANGGRAKGANTTSPAVVSSGQLNGNYSLNFATSGAGTIGDMYISSTYKIPIAYQNTVLQVKFKYKVVSGSPVMAGTKLNTYACAIYDLDNNSWSTMALVGNFNFVQSSGVGTFTGTFQVPYNSTQFQIAIYNPVAPTGASSLYVDDFYVGPQISTTGPAVSDWVAYTPTFTGFGTPTSVTFYSRRVGDSLEINGRFVSGTSTATLANITLGFNGINSNVTIDTTKLSVGLAGYATTGLSSTTFFGLGVLANGGNGYVQFGSQTSTGGIPSTAQSGSAIVSSGQTFAMYAKVPIVGWSSNTVMSNDTDTRVVACSRACGTQISVPTSVYTYIDFTTNNLDTHSAWRTGVSYNSGTGAWTTSPGYVVPVSGIYHITTNILYPGAANSKQVYIVKNGSAIGNGANDVTQASNTTLTATATYSFVAGDIIGVQLWQTSGGALTVPGSISSFWSHIEIQRLSGPAVIAATETVSALYVPTTVPTGTLAAAWNFVTFNTKIKDSHGAYSGNTYRIPVTGQWDISSFFSITATYTAGAILGIGISIDGVTNPTYSRAPRIAGSTTNPIGVDIEIKSVPLKAGQTVQIMVYCSAASASFESASGAHQFSILRSGNY